MNNLMIFLLTLALSIPFAHASSTKTVNNTFSQAAQHLVAKILPIIESEKFEEKAEIAIQETGFKIYSEHTYNYNMIKKLKNSSAMDQQHTKKLLA